MRKQKIKVCFVSLNSYPLFLKKSKGYFGGAEVQMSLIVKTLAQDKNFRISLITGDYGQKRVEKKEGVAIYRCFDQDNYNFKRIWQFLKTLKEIDADVYIDRTMGPKLGLLNLFGKLYKKKIVYMAAHDWDCSFKFKDYLNGPFKWLYYWGLKNTNLIISQKDEQKKALKNNFKLDSLMIKSIVKPVKLKKTKKKFVLWVGRADRWKQPQKMINLAKKIAKEKVVMICRQGADLNYFNFIKKLAEMEANISFLPVVPFEEISQIYAQAKVLVNTSEAEGFPNTFLQAGLVKSPILSLRVNPDDFINRFNCGFVAKDDQRQLVKLARKMLKDSKQINKMGQNHYDYVKKFHSLKNVKMFKKALCDL